MEGNDLKFDSSTFDMIANFENGSRRRDNGILKTQAKTVMSNVAPKMVKWWFSSYMTTTEHYKRWYPEAHLWMDWESKKANELIGAQHLLDEYVGKDIHKLRIEFVHPSRFIPSYVESENRWAASTHPDLRATLFQE